MTKNYLNIDRVPPEILKMEAPEPVIFKTPLFDADPRSRDELAVPGIAHDELITIRLQDRFEKYEHGALLENPRLRDLGSVSGIRYNFPEYPNVKTAETEAWCNQYGECMADLPALEITSVWQFVLNYEAEFAFAFGKCRAKTIRIIEAIASHSLPNFATHYRNIMALGRSMACYPVAPEADWVATWYVLQETMVELRNELCNKGNSPWLTALANVLHYHPYCDTRCALYWISMWRRQNLVIRQAIKAGYFQD